MTTYPHAQVSPAKHIHHNGDSPPRRRRGLDRKQKAQIAVAVITTLPQLIWAIAFLLSTLMGS